MKYKVNYRTKPKQGLTSRDEVVIEADTIKDAVTKFTMSNPSSIIYFVVEVDASRWRGANSLNTHINLIIMDNYKGLTQQQFNEIQAAYYMQQLELNQQEQEFTTMVENKVAAKLIVNCLSRLFSWHSQQHQTSTSNIKHHG